MWGEGGGRGAFGTTTPGGGVGEEVGRYSGRGEKSQLSRKEVGRGDGGWGRKSDLAPGTLRKKKREASECQTAQTDERDVGGGGEESASSTQNPFFSPHSRLSPPPHSSLHANPRGKRMSRRLPPAEGKREMRRRREILSFFFFPLSAALLWWSWKGSGEGRSFPSSSFLVKKWRRRRRRRRR